MSSTATVRNVICGVFLPMCLITLGIVVGLIIIDNGYDKDVADNREQAKAAGELVARELVTAMSDSLNTARILGAFVMGEDTPIVDHNGTKAERMILINSDKLEKLGIMLKKRFSSVGSLQIQPSAVVTQAYPALTPGKPPHGHDLYNDVNRRADIFAGIKARSMMVAGPFPLVQGGIGILSRYPVFKLPPEISSAEFAAMTVNESLKYWWGMTASLVQIEVLLHQQVKITEILKAGETDYVLEYFNANSESIVVVHSQTNALNVTASNVGRAGLRGALESLDFYLVPISLPGDRHWNLWVRKPPSDYDKNFRLIICIAVSMIGAGIISSIYWGPYIARNRLYSVLIEIFEEIIEMNIQSVDQRLPSDSPIQFVYRMQQMLDALLVYRSFLPQSITACDAESDETKCTRETRLSMNNKRQSTTIGTDDSNKSIKSHKSVKQAASGLALSCGLVSKDGTIVVFEATDHLYLKDNNLEREHQKFMQVVLDSIKQVRSGKVYSVSGGCIVVELNCSKPSVSHCLTASSLLLMVVKTDASYRGGVSSGKVCCGILGSSSMMSFVICGRPMEEGRLLARYAVELPLGRGIVSEKVRETCEGRVVCMPLDLVRYQLITVVIPTPVDRIETIYLALSVCEQQNIEWMYLLANNAEEKRMQPYTSLWRHCMVERLTFSAAQFEEIRDSGDNELDLLVARLVQKYQCLPVKFTHTITLGVIHQIPNPTQ